MLRHRRKCHAVAVAAPMRKSTLARTRVPHARWRGEAPHSAVGPVKLINLVRRKRTKHAAWSYALCDVRNYRGTRTSSGGGGGEVVRFRQLPFKLALTVCRMCELPLQRQLAWVVVVSTRKTLELERVGCVRACVSTWVGVCGNPKCRNEGNWFAHGTLCSQYMHLYISFYAYELVFHSRYLTRELRRDELTFACAHHVSLIG